MSKLPQISEAEYEVMKIVWRHSPISTKQVIEKLVQTSKWNPKTIQTLLLRLVKKKALSYEKDGKMFVYTPMVKEEEVLKQESKSFLDRFYNGALNTMVVNFLEQDQLSKEDIKELRRILNERLKEGDE